MSVIMEAIVIKLIGSFRPPAYLTANPVAVRAPFIAVVCRLAFVGVFENHGVFENQEPFNPQEGRDTAWPALGNFHTGSTRVSDHFPPASFRRPGPGGRGNKAAISHN